MDKEYYYPEIGDQLGDFQPNLEFKTDSGEWVESGILRGRMTESFKNCYRIHKKYLDKTFRTF